MLTKIKNKLGLIPALFFLVLAAYSFSANATEQRYTIVNAEGRIFLLDTQEGSVWRFYFNKTSEQGWTQTLFERGSSEKNNYVSSSPNSEMIALPKIN